MSIHFRGYSGPETSIMVLSEVGVKGYFLKSLSTGSDSIPDTTYPFMDSL